MTATGKAPHILILGAGLAGLVLAQALRKQGISFEIFERDASVHARFQGWAIALHQILPDFEASLPKDLGDIEGTNHLLPLDVAPQFNYWSDGKLISSYTRDATHHLLRANRSRLRDYFVQKLDIQWGKNVTTIEETSDSVTLHFADGTSATGDILVGADGVHSKVRTHLLSGADPLNTLALGMIGGEVRVEKQDYERLLELGHSAYIASAPSGQRIFVGVNDIAPDESYANMYWMTSWPNERLDSRGHPWTYYADKHTLHQTALQTTSDLDPKFQEVIRLTKEEDIIKPAIVLRDLILDSLPASRITLVGDSAHAMTPFRGQGGNLAMQDSLNLARTITQLRDASLDRETVVSRLQDHANEMLTRTRPIVLASRDAAMLEGDRTYHFEKAWSQATSALAKESAGRTAIAA